MVRQVEARSRRAGTAVLAIRARCGAVRREVEAAGELPEHEGEARPQGGVVAVLVEVPARAAAARPDRLLHAPAAAWRCTPAGPRRALRMWRGRGVSICCRALDKVVDRRLGHVDHRAVAEPHVGADHEDHVREAGDGRALVGTLPVLAPDVAEGLAVAALDQVVRRRIGDVETGRDDDRVHLANGAVRGHDRRSDVPRRCRR